MRQGTALVNQLRNWISRADSLRAVLKPSGRLALSDIVTDVPLPEGVTCDAALWAACSGGAMLLNDYIAVIEATGFKVTTVRDNDEYKFLSERADSATTKYQVKSVSILAIKRT